MRGCDAIVIKHPTVSGLEHRQTHSLQRCASDSAVSPSPTFSSPFVIDDQTTADAAYRMAREGKALLWRGDFHNARQLLQAMARRVDKRFASPSAQRADRQLPAQSMKETFDQHRLAQGQRAAILNLLLIPFEADYRIPLRRAPDVRQACIEAYGEWHADESSPRWLIPLRELQGIIGAHEWRKKGVPVAALNARIHPHYGVFAPVRGEYVGLVNDAPLPAALNDLSLAFDIGTGTGVLAAVLARRGITRVIATDQNPRALACAVDNLTRLGLAGQVTVMPADLFPAGRAPLIVCNPPWVPAQPNSALDEAIFDPDSRMLRGFLTGLSAHLTPGGEGWLVLSDIAEHLGLRTRDELLAMIASAGLTLAGRLDVRPTHRRASDTSDPLHAARAAEVTSLWRLVVA
jgi:methylase of polypeptide subunit release factors